MELIYNEKDITEDVRILRVEYECFLGEHADRLLTGAYMLHADVGVEG